MMNVKHLLTTTLTVVFLLGCEMPHLLPTVEPVAKRPAQQLSSPQSSIAKTYLRPDFEPMNLEQYKAAYPHLAGLDCGMEQFFDTYINVFGVTIA
ncbi:MAG: hypothetical protein P8L18_11240, partial [Verrucomicrobiota bacterium]|nr:hypothetical protein [Verrucomicrobiota bacterium]